MKSERFNELLDELDGCSLQTLKEKNARYAQNGDCLHNFRSGADVAGGTPAQACWGYLTKHLVALRDKVEKNDFSNREDFLEKCQDTINYIRFLWCIGNDENSKLTCRDKIGRVVDPDRENLHEMVDAMTERDGEPIPYPPCAYVMEKYGVNKCRGTKELDPCPGYDKCDRYHYRK